MLNDITLRKEKISYMDTQYGHISYLEWCEKECKRIGNAKLCQNKKNCWLEFNEKTLDKE